MILIPTTFSFKPDSNCFNSFALSSVDKVTTGTSDFVSVNANSIFSTVCSYHVTYAFQSESTLYSCLNVKELLARNRHKIWSLSGFESRCSHLIFSVAEEIPQSSDQVRLRLILLLINSISRVLQKLLKYFNGTTVSIIFVLLSAGVLLL